MNKRSFLEELGTHLAALGADEKTVAAQKEKMDAYLRSKNMENVDVAPDKMTEGIMEKLRAEAAKVNAGQPTAPEAKSEAPATAANTDENNSRKAPEIMEKLRADVQKTAVHKKEQEASEKAPTKDAPEASSEPSAEDDPLSALNAKLKRIISDEPAEPAAPAKTEEAVESKRNAPGDHAPVRPKSAEHPVKSPEAVKANPPTPARPVDNDNDYYGGDAKEKITDPKNKTLFWVLFCIAVPFAVVLAAAVVVAFLGLIFALAAIAIGFVVALICMVAVGCSVAFIGIIYGAYKIVTGLVPVGMYEIGLGITIGAIVMFVGIIMYNIAIRLVPYLMKKLAQLVAFAFRKAREGVIALKGVLEKQ